MSERSTGVLKAGQPPAVACGACPLRRLPTFVEDTAEEIAFIQSLKVGEILVPARGSIIDEGEPSDRLFTLLSGWAFRFKTLPDGRRQILNFLMPGDLVGLQAKLFSRAAHGIEALSDVRLCRFSRHRVWDMYREQPSIAFDVTWLSAREEGIVDVALLSAGRRTAAERMAALLLQLFQRARSLGMVKDGAVALPLTQLHLADALGLSLMHTNRTVRFLRENGYCDLAGSTLRRVDLPAMRRLAKAAETDPERRPLI